MALVLRHAAVLLAAIAITLFPAGAALAHNGHAALPDGFRAGITGLRDADGAAANLPGVDVRVAPGGIGLTVQNTSDRAVEVSGEQAGEPLLRVTADKAWVNQASPQAKDVEGAEVDPAAAADLIDLVWQRAPADWVPLPQGGTATVLDHRGAPGHPPVRADYETGDTAGEFTIAFTVDGEPYQAAGTIAAVEPAGTAGGLSRALMPAAVAAALLLGAGLLVAGRRLAPRLSTSKTA